MALCEFLQAVVCLLIYQVTLFDPALEPLRSTHQGKTSIAIDDLHPLTVLDDPYSVVNGSDLVAERSLDRGDVGHFQHTMPAAVAGRKRQNAGQRYRQCAVEQMGAIQSHDGRVMNFHYSALRREFRGTKVYI